MVILYIIIKQKEFIQQVLMNLTDMVLSIQCFSGWHMSHNTCG